MTIDAFLKEAMFYENTKDDSVRCNLCALRCELQSGKIGFCNVRQNIDGKLYSLVYGKPCSMAVDSIERRPFFHFKPGSSILTLATIGCNFRCNFCVNSEISQEKTVTEQFVSPQQVINTALAYGADGICFAYTEPTIFAEYLLDITNLAKKSSLFCSMITNGYMTPEAWETISKNMDAVLVNLKYSGNQDQMQKMAMIHDVNPIFDFIESVSESGVHLEVSDLIMPDHSQESFQRLCQWLGNEIGSKTPFHLLQFHPSFKLEGVPPTDIHKMLEMKQYAQRHLDFVYLSNLPITEHANTLCPKCKNTIIRRIGFMPIETNIIGSSCSFCNETIHGKFEAI